MDEDKTEKLLKIISELRDPKTGCEWTKSQTAKTLLPFIEEEAQEFLMLLKEDKIQRIRSANCSTKQDW